MTNNESPIVLVSLYSKNAPGGLLDLSDSIIAFEFEDLDTKADKCVLTVRNTDWSNFDTRVWHAGARLRIQWGYYGNLTPPREMVVQAQKGGGGGSQAIRGTTELAIECHDYSVLLNKRKVVKTYRNKTRSEVATEIAEAWGYGPDRQFITQTNQKKTITQAAMTDAELLAKMGKAEGFKFYIDFDGFHWHERAFNQVPKRVWSYGRALGNSEVVIEASVENDATVLRPKAIKVKGIDKKTGAAFEVVASNEDTEREGLAANLQGTEDISAKVTPTSNGAEDVSNFSEIPDDIAEAANFLKINENDGTTASFLLALEKPTITVNDNSSQNAEEAKSKADAKFREMVAVAVKLNITVLGDPAFGAKKVFFFECPSKRITGRYYAKKVVHRISAGEYLLDIESISDGGNDGKGTKSEAVVNDKDPPPSAGPNASSETNAALEEYTVIDPRDGTTKTMYR